MRLRDFILAWLPPAVAAELERESRSWIMTCSAGHERSVWEAGGLRYRARGKPIKLAWCPQCGGWRAHTLAYRGTAEIGPTSDQQATSGWRRHLEEAEGPVARDGSASALVGSQPVPDPYSPTDPRVPWERPQAIPVVSAILGWSLSVIGVIFLLIAIGMCLPAWLARPSTIRVEGRVERLVSGGRQRPGQSRVTDAGRRSRVRSGRGKVPLVRYEVEGKSYLVAGKVATSPPAYTEGETVWVRYPPAAPEKGWIDSVIEQYLLSIIFGSVGMVMGLIGMIMTLRAWMQSPPQPRFE